MPSCSCTCGAQIKLPESGSSAAFRCPRCKAELVAAGEGRIVTAPWPIRRRSRGDLPGLPVGHRPERSRARLPELATRCTIANAGPRSAAVRLTAARTRPGARRPLRPRPRDPPGATSRNAPLAARKSSRSPCAAGTAAPISTPSIRSRSKTCASRSSRRSGSDNQTLVIVLFVLSILGCPAPILAFAAPGSCRAATQDDRQGRAGLSGHGLFRDRDLPLIFDTVCCFFSSHWDRQLMCRCRLADRDIDAPARAVPRRG